MRDNTRGVMAGIDANDQPMLPVTYRTGVAKPIKRTGRKRAIPARGGFTAGGLTTAQYKLLTGPPLAPRGLGSRVITNLETGHSTGSPWFAVGAWRDVVDAKGRAFLKYAFELRDLRGVRAEGRAEARALLRIYLRRLMGWG